jgi:hypothetical protein
MGLSKGIVKAGSLIGALETNRLVAHATTAGLADRLKPVVLVVELTEDRRGTLGPDPEELGGFLSADDAINVQVGADELPMLVDRLRSLVAP